jgi:hypothetical protein
MRAQRSGGGPILEELLGISLYFSLSLVYAGE